MLENSLKPIYSKYPKDALQFDIRYNLSVFSLFDAFLCIDTVRPERNDNSL